MTDPNVLKFTLATEDFDLSLLPSAAHQYGTALFRDAVKAYLTAEFQSFGGWHSVEVSDQTIEISWTPDRQSPDALAQVGEKLKRGEYA